MRDMVACFSEHAVRVSETTCSTYTNHHQRHQLPFISQNTTPATQTAVILDYKITLSSNKQLPVTITWSSTQMGPQGLTISFGEDPSSTTTFKLNTVSRIFRKKKGARSIEVDDFKIELMWDLSEVIYENGAEPIDGYYIVIMVDSELGLMLGDLSTEVASKKINNGASMAKVSLVSKKEHFVGSTTLYSTKAQFGDKGGIHEISIRCGGGGDGEGLKQPVLVVTLDKRNVARVKRLQWNFRGSQTIFVDGLLFDLFYDVHDWFFSHGNGLAVFMFKRRCGVDSRLWLEDKMAANKKEDQENPEFSLLIYASKSL